MCLLSFLPSLLSVSDPCQLNLFAIVLSVRSISVSNFPAEASGCPPISFPVYGTDWYPAFEGHLCFDTEHYCSPSEMNLNLFECTTYLYKGVKQILWFSPLLYPIMEDLEWIREAKLLSLIYAKPQEAFGTVPLHQMVVVVKPATYLQAYCYAVMAGCTFLSKEAGSMVLLHLSKE